VEISGELEAPLWEVIVTWCGGGNPNRPSPNPFPRPDIHFDTFLARTEARVLVDESVMAMAVV
jgi:hypothetical protein